jgi:hypothetical protein
LMLQDAALAASEVEAPLTDLARKRDVGLPSRVEVIWMANFAGAAAGRAETAALQNVLVSGRCTNQRNAAYLNAMTAAAIDDFMVFMLFENSV